MNICVVYSSITGRMRWGTNGAPSTVRLQGAEALLVVPREDFRNMNELQAIVTAACGKTPTDDRFVIIDASGNVKGAVLAYPACGDSIPGHTLVKSAEAKVGWTLDDGVLVAPAVPVYTEVQLTAHDTKLAVTDAAVDVKL